MILGFAHITKNCVGNLADATPSYFLVEPVEKVPLMAHGYHPLPTKQWLILDEVNGVPVEFVAYDTGVVKGRCRIDFDDSGCIWLPSRDLDAERAFFCAGLGFQADDHSVEIIRLSSAVLKWRTTMNICQEADAPLDPPLNIIGYAALAFYSSDVEADRDHLLKHGGRTPTEPFTVKLDREMKIVMLRSPEGTIIELIQVLPG